MEIIFVLNTVFYSNLLYFLFLVNLTISQESDFGQSGVPPTNILDSMTGNILQTTSFSSIDSSTGVNVATKDGIYFPSIPLVNIIELKILILKGDDVKGKMENP